MATSSRLWVDNGLYPQETLVVTLYQVLPCQRINFFTIISFPRKFAECLYYDVTPPLILPVLSSTVYTVIQVTFIHTFIQLYVRTLILSHINAYTTYTWYQFIHGCISHPNLVRSYLFKSVFAYHCVKLQVPTNEQLVIIIFIKSVIPSVSGQEMSLINHFKWQVWTTGQLASFLLLLSYAKWQVRTTGQLASPFYLLSYAKWQVRTTGQLASSLLLLSCVKWQVLHMNNLQILSIFSKKCHSQCVWSRNVTCLFQAASPKQRTAWVYFLSCFKLLVLNNGPLEFTFLPCFQAASPKQRNALSLSFLLFQAASPKQWTTWVYFYHVFKWSVINNGQLEFILYRVSSRQS